MRWIYFILMGLRNKEKEVSFDGIAVQFNVRTPLELRVVERVFEEGPTDEKYVLKNLLSAISPNDVVYDIGASFGIHTIFLGRKVGPNGLVVAFEPENLSYKLLQANIRLNNLNNVEPIQVALGNRDSAASLYSDGITGVGTLLSDFRGKITQKVKIVPGDALIRGRDLPLPKVVKIDVEGYEYYVIKGLRKTLSDKSCEMICCEVHPTMLPLHITPETVIELIKSLGYSRIEHHSREGVFHLFCHRSDVLIQK